MKAITTVNGFAILGSCILATSVLYASQLAGGASAQIQAVETAMAAGGDKVADFDSPVAAKFQSPEAITTCESYSGGWFNPDIHLFPNCVGNAGQIGALPLAASDVNGDGQIEFFDYKSPSVDRSFFWVVQNGVGLNGSAELYRTSTSAAAYVRTDILPFGPDLGAGIRAKVGAVPGIGVTPKGWRDMDGDGDLDLVVVIEIFYVTNNDALKGQKDAWFENIGFQHQSPVVGDLDGDGSVNTADLSLLLLNFTD
jgi:hypothetical protein